MRSAVSTAWGDLTDPVVGLPERLDRSSRMTDFLLFVCIGLNAGVTVPGVGTTIGEVAAIPAVGLAMTRRPERGWRRLGPVTPLICALGGWFLVSGLLNGVLPPMRLAHVFFYLGVILCLGTGRVDAVAAVRGTATGLVIALVHDIATFGSSSYAGRLSGFLGDPNSAGYYLLVLGLVYLAIETHRRRRLVIGALCAAGIVLTYSRTTLLAAGLVAFWVLMPRRVPVWFKSAVTAALFTRISAVAESLKNQGVFSSREGSDDLRERLYPLEQQIVSSKQLTGHGPGSLTVTLDGQDWFFHSSYLLLRSEGGWVLFALMLMLVAGVALRLARPVSGMRNRLLEGAVLAVLVCAVNLGNVFLDYPAAVAFGVALWWGGAPRAANGTAADAARDAAGSARSVGVPVSEEAER